MKIEANDLLLFARVTDAGSFTRAAERMGLPKSTVSRRIANMETALGERLLLRSTRKLVLTEFGQHVLEHARQIASELDAAVALVQHRQAEPSGLLRLSLPGDFAVLVLDDFLQEFSQRYPQIRLEIDLSPRRVDLLAENFDLALRMGDLPSDAMLAARRIALFNVGLYASQCYVAVNGLLDGPEQLNSHHTLAILKSSGGAQPWTLQKGKATQHIQPQPKFCANSPQLLIRMACRGLGIAAVTESFAKPYLERGELVRILPDWCLPPVAAWAVFPERRLMPAKTRVFLDQLEQALKA
ncbi:LysR family transcriptional regulator [Iodobacter sp. CM08]|uniref:LysR family transcriptional regulator n=1 Tax=Iodobacter sp. CM08 TaxID=3085902 RepID=UPI0029816597|nr:LysR family transcriptional regulator [Iodobacter sp. CM08]MDW5415977.1 LysR family transcriptional regulator [Iodobacter sp. CM08]